MRAHITVSLLAPLGLWILVSFTASSPALARCDHGCGCSPTASQRLLRPDEIHLRRPAEPASTETGHAIVAALQEVTGLLLADPATDWSTVDIDRVRSHLVDLDRVMRLAKVDSRPIDGGLEIAAGGDAATRAALHRVVQEHARLSSFRGWRVDFLGESDLEAEADGRLRLRLLTDTPDDLQRLRALGFFGYLAVGVHRPHQLLAIARGRE